MKLSERGVRPCGDKVIMPIFTEPEGATPLEPDEIEGLVHTHIETRDELNALESANIADCLVWLSSQSTLSLEEILSLDFARTLHEEMFSRVWSWAGNFRTTEKNIGCDPSQIRVNLYNLFEDIKCWIEFNHYESRELSARIHHQLVKIHPFPNGNGRHARIFTNCVREKGLGIEPIIWATGNIDRQGEERREYIDSLRQADQNNYQPLVSYLVDRGN